MTQAIQQLQALADLKGSLADGGSPPVPIVAGKPGVMRVYLAPLALVVKSNVTLTVQNSFGAEIFLQELLGYIVPQCTVTLQRHQSMSCQSLDFYFTPPTGDWTATLNVTDVSNNMLEQEVLSFTSVPCCRGRTTWA
jgi:hypothetical protein